MTDTQARRRRRTDRWLASLTLAIGGLGVALVVLSDPRTSPLPGCLFRIATGGLLCPGCGSGRMIHALGQGDLSRAASLNPVALAILPFALYWALGLAFLAIRGRSLPSIPTPRWWMPFAITALLAWWLLRNLIPSLCTAAA